MRDNVLVLCIDIVETIDIFKQFMKDTKDEVVNGKLLVQYKPAPDCFSKAWHRVWFQSDLLYMKGGFPLEISNPNSKRDNSSACTISEVASSTSAASPTSTLTTTSTTTTSTIAKPKTITATAPASPISCYNRQKLSCYKAVTPDAAHSKSDKFCSSHQSIIGRSGPTWRGIRSVLNDFSDRIS
ncbi:hypothetical protein GGR54DRAFT_608464 [Hypoxylon sp. NC1633]|nr:hypothetical protein GGR54DRAFT_608464 [Hypoxylon sp. NC1633]